MENEVKELSLVERVFAFLKDKLTKDKAEPVNKTEMARVLGESADSVSNAMKKLQEENVIVQDGKQGSVNTYKLGEAAPENGKVLVYVNNHIIISTPAGTEVMAAFAILEDRYREITANDVEEMRDSLEPVTNDDDDEEDWNEEENNWKGRGSTWEDEVDEINGMDRYELRRFASKNGITLPKFPHNSRSAELRVTRALIKKEYKKIFEARTTPPEVFFQFVKSKLKKTELEDLSKRMLKLSGMVRSTELTGQRALYEHLVLELCGIVREQEIAAMGTNITLPEKVITQLVPMVPHLKYDRFENFPRIVPKFVMDRVASVKLANLFDEYHILFIEGKSPNITTTEEKIRRKDPILFGKINEFPERLYFIIDWTDEFCDMTLAKMVNTIQTSDPEFSLDKIGMVDPEYFAKAAVAAKQRFENLKKTGVKNYRQLMREEREASLAREKQARLEYAMAETNEDEFIKKLVEAKGESWLKNVREQIENPPKPETIQEDD